MKIKLDNMFFYDPDNLGGSNTEAKDLDNLSDEDINNLSVEDIDKLMDFDGNDEESELDDSTSSPDKETDKEEEIIGSKKEEDESGKPETKNEEENKDDPKTEPEKDNSEEGKPNLLVVDEEFIKNADEKDRKALEKIKGETLTPKMLNIHLNREKLIGRKVITPEDLGEKPNQREVTDTTNNVKVQSFETNDKGVLPHPTEEKQKANEVKSKYLVERMKAKFPDYPTTSEEEGEMAYSNPRRWGEILQAEANEKAFINDLYEKASNFQRNYATVNKQVIDADISKIEEEAKGLGLNLSELGIDLSYDKNGENDVIDLLLTDGKGNFDPNVVTMRYGKPEILPGKIGEKFFSANFRNILNIVRASATKKALTDANNSHFDPSISTMKGAGHNNPAIKDKDIENITDPAELEKIEKELFNE